MAFYALQIAARCACFQLGISMEPPRDATDREARPFSAVNTKLGVGQGAP